jgi:DMSO/TMAO reductase YedYZ heme-binding membrane subunit
MPTAVDVSGTIALCAVGLLTLNLLLGLLLSVGYNPRRQWPRKAFKLFTLHNWTAYVAFAAVVLHAGALLLSKDPPFRLYDVLLPIESPVQPFSNNLGALGFYLVTIVVVTSLKRARAALGRRLWKPIHYTTYAAAFVFFSHGIIADPEVKNRPVDFIDAEKVYVELCALAVVAATVWRVRHRRALRRAAQSLSRTPAATACPSRTADRPLHRRQSH